MADKPYVQEGLRLTDLREAMGMSQDELVCHINKSKSTLNLCEKGFRKFNDSVYNRIILLAHRRGIKASGRWLVFGEGESGFEKIELENDAQKPNSGLISTTLKTNEFEPHFYKGTTIRAALCAPEQFIKNWNGFYLFKFKDSLCPAKIESNNCGLFNAETLHNNIRNKIVLKDIAMDFLYPITSIEMEYR